MHKKFKRPLPNRGEFINGGSAKDLYDFVRMLDDGYPRAFIYWGNYKVELFDANLVDDDEVVVKAAFKRLRYG